IDATVTNHGSTTVDWTVSLTVDGTLTQIWNAVYQANGGETLFGGVDWNNLLAAGAQTTFGFCADRAPVQPASACADGIDNDGDGLIDYPDDPGCDHADDNDESNPPPSGGQGLDVSVTTTTDWQSGYCADVSVANPTASAIDWQITFTVEGRIYDLWNANYLQNGNTVTADGVSWNNLVPAGGSVGFGFCANR
ncbi:MAG: cellulose binding domain-containing protein, partial [Gammaproteobacteria bacterium]